MSSEQQVREQSVCITSTLFKMNQVFNKYHFMCIYSAIFRWVPNCVGGLGKIMAPSGGRYIPVSPRMHKHMTTSSWRSYRPYRKTARFYHQKHFWQVYGPPSLTFTAALGMYIHKTQC